MKAKEKWRHEIISVLNIIKQACEMARRKLAKISSLKAAYVKAYGSSENNIAINNGSSISNGSNESVTAVCHVAKSAIEMKKNGIETSASVADNIYQQQNKASAWRQ